MTVWSCDDSYHHMAKRDRSTLNFQTPTEVRDALEAAARSEQRSISNLAVRLLTEGLMRMGFLPKDFVPKPPKGRS